MAATRGWRLWTDDAAIVDLVGVLYPALPVERISDLLSRAVVTGLIPCPDAADLDGGSFKAELGLWSRLSAVCEQGELVFRSPRRAPRLTDCRTDVVLHWAASGDELARRGHSPTRLPLATSAIFM